MTQAEGKYDTVVGRGTQAEGLWTRVMGAWVGGEHGTGACPLPRWLWRDPLSGGEPWLWSEEWQTRLGFAGALQIRQRKRPEGTQQVYDVKVACGSASTWRATACCLRPT